MRFTFDDFMSTLITIVCLTGILIGSSYMVIPKYQVMDDGRIFNKITGTFMPEEE